MTSKLWATTVVAAVATYTWWSLGARPRAAFGLGAASGVAFAASMETRVRVERRRERRARARRRTEKAWAIAADWRALGVWVHISEEPHGILVAAFRECPPRPRLVGKAKVWMWQGEPMVRMVEYAWLQERRRELGREIVP